MCFTAVVITRWLLSSKIPRQVFLHKEIPSTFGRTRDGPDETKLSPKCGPGLSGLDKGALCPRSQKSKQIYIMQTPVL